MNGKEPIKFGTSGWRGILAEDFTFDRVRVVAQSIAEHLKETSGDGPGRVIVGYDTRFLGKRFAGTVASVLAGNGIGVIRSTDPVPTPVVSFEIIQRKLSGGVTVTASHNPPEWNGLKFSPAWGGPALPETTRQIETRANALLEDPTEIPRMEQAEAERKGIWKEERTGDAYREKVSRLLDRSVFEQGKLRVAVDPFWGTSLGYLDRILLEMGAAIDLIHDERNPNFGGIRPDPEGESLAELIGKTREGNYDLGLATDCDADRFGILDRGGIPIVPNYIIALLVDYLVTDRKWTGKIARSVATSHLVDAVARHHHLEVIETPVGFKYIGELIAKNEILLGGEESGGISIRGHLPEKDGILTCLLVAEMVAKRKRSIRAMLDDLFRQVGAFYPMRRDLHLSEKGRERVAALLKNPPAAIGGKKVLSTSKLDGTKFFLEGGSWTLIRPSGTEPLVRLYVETPAEKESELLAAACQALIE
ncbi:MAG: phosphoglucomutase/phosphomannomutase family protein [Candidatus Manganitrophaceae bacterium]|nr:MAG: phosphoglucomutase/phosphomannomutase family protein [Candidatus Manganitrophaceae bacterium]